MADTTEAHGAEAADVFPPFDPAHFSSQLFWLAITFAVLYLLLSRVFLPRVGDILERRSGRIANDIDEAERLNEQAKASKVALEQSLAEARAKGRNMASEARASVEAEIAADSAKVDAELETKMVAAREKIEGMKAKALEHVDEIAIDTADAIVSALGSKATATQIKKAVEKAL